MRLVTKIAGGVVTVLIAIGAGTDIGTVLLAVATVIALENMS